MSAGVFVALAYGAVLALQGYSGGPAVAAAGGATGLLLLVRIAFEVARSRRSTAEASPRMASVLVWIALYATMLATIFIPGIPRTVNLPLVTSGLLWLVLDQPGTRSLLLSVGVVAASLVMTLATADARSDLVIASGVAAAGLLLVALSRSGSMESGLAVRERLAGNARTVRRWPILLTITLLAALAGSLSPRENAPGGEEPGRPKTVAAVAAALSGFNADLDPASFTLLKKSDVLVLEVEIEDAAGGPDAAWTFDAGDELAAEYPPILLRGASRSTADGRSFKASVPSDPPRRDPRTLSRYSTRGVRQTVRRQFDAPGYRFALSSVEVIEDGPVRHDGFGGIAPRRRDDPFAPHRVVSRVFERQAMAELSVLAPRALHPYAEYRRLPAGDVERFAPLLAEAIGPDPTIADVEKVARIESWLRDSGKFRYSLANRNDRSDPYYAFLVDKGSGPCVLFAGAMALLCRAADIPARTVTGFRGGSYSNELKAYRILASDAHAWVEVAYEGIGWVPYDPTPPEARRDADVREGPAPGTETTPSAVARVLPQWLADTWKARPAPVAASVGLLLLLLLLAGAGLRRRRYGRGKPRATSLEAEIVRLLGTGGALDRRSATLLELLAEATGLAPEARRLAERAIGAAYAIRYGGVAWERGELAALEDAVRAASRSVR